LEEAGKEKGVWVLGGAFDCKRPNRALTPLVEREKNVSKQNRKSRMIKELLEEALRSFE